MQTSALHSYQKLFCLRHLIHPTAINLPIQKMAPKTRTRSRAKSNPATVPINATNLNEDSMDVDVEPQIKLKSSDGKRFTMSKSEAFCSNTLRSLIESCQPANRSTNSILSMPSECITLSSINSQMLAKIIEWCQRHSNEVPDYESHANNNANRRRDNPTFNLTEWSKSFFKDIPEVELLRLMHAANYLDVTGLLDSACQTIAKRWEGKKVEEIRRMYGIVSDFDADEEHKMLLDCKKLGLDH